MACTFSPLCVVVTVILATIIRWWHGNTDCNWSRFKFWVIFDKQNIDNHKKIGGFMLMDGCVLLTSTPWCVVLPQGDYSDCTLLIAWCGEMDVNNTNPSMINKKSMHWVKCVTQSHTGQRAATFYKNLRQTYLQLSVKRQWNSTDSKWLTATHCWWQMTAIEAVQGVYERVCQIRCGVGWVKVGRIIPHGPMAWNLLQHRRKHIRTSITKALWLQSNERVVG